ncbi:low affinity immunoglobulin gamma Fc region receptor II-like protein [Lates japonicus]|nr:low affinity immunoglobulin gamma Fc region receptor II-like protein [Lates japonicus]GLD68125.1 low affinity immunoglobulin gamma Fc region receptor II-like protein [Lates japonicus]
MEFTGFLFTLLFSSCTYMFGRVHASLTVFPYRSQLFKYESFSLSCDESRKSSGWTVKARTVRGLSECGQDWGSLQESSCVINEAYSWHSGVYWCESTAGERSPAVNISITDAPDAPDAPLLSVSRLICLLLVGTPYLLSTILLGLIYRDKMKAQRDEETSNSSEVQTEDVM